LSEGTAIHNSHCYIAEHQAIDSKRKLLTASQRQVAWLAKKFRTEIAKAVEPSAELSAVSLKSAGKRKPATVCEILKEFPNDSFFQAQSNHASVVKFA
jgi:hypothetical protein